MAIEKKTIIDQIEITRSGVVQIRFGLLLVEDGKEIAPIQWHRTSIPPGTDPEAQIAEVNSHLVRVGKSEVDNDMIPVLNVIVSALHTPEVIQTYRERQARVVETLPPQLRVPEKPKEPGGPNE